MHFVINQVVQLEHVHVADGDVAVERFAGAAVVKAGLTALRQPGQLQHALHFGFFRPVKDWRRHRYPGTQILAKGDEITVIKTVERFALAVMVIDFVQIIPQFARFFILVEHLADAQPDATRRPAEVRFQHLADVHPRGYAERVEADINRSTIFHIRHVFHRNDA